MNKPHPIHADGALAASDSLLPTWQECLVIASLTALVTFFAAAVVPLYDDGSLWQLIYDYDGQIARNYVDRPVSGQLWQALSDRDLFWPGSIALHFLSWCGMAFAATVLFRAAFPRWSQYAIAAGCLVLAMVIVQTQQVLITATVHCLLGPSIVYVSVAVMLLAATRRSYPNAYVSAALFGLAFLATGLGNLVSEYAFAAAISATVFLSVIKWTNGECSRLRWWQIAVFAISAAVGYFVYRSIGELPEHKTEGGLLEEGLLRSADSRLEAFLAVSGRLFSAWWHVSLGRLLQEVGSIQSGSKIYASSMVIGLVAAVGATVLLFRSRRGGGFQATRPPVAVWVGLTAAVLIALFPVLALGRSFIDHFQTRTIIPVLPAACALSVSLMLYLLGPRLMVGAVPLCVFLVAYTNSVHGLHAIDEARTVTKWGDELKKHLSDDGLTVAVFEIPRRRQIPIGSGWIGSFSNNEFTARMAQDWPREKRLRFWAFRDWDTALEHIDGLKHNGATGKAPVMDRETRGSFRKAAVRRILWVNVREHDLTLAVKELDMNAAVAARQDDPQSVATVKPE